MTTAAEAFLAALTPERRERFWARVECGGPQECWPWTGARAKSGQGTWTVPRVDRAGTTSVRPHHVAWVAEHGWRGDVALPEPCAVDPACCNVAHLAAGRSGPRRRRGRGAHIDARPRADGSIAYRVMFTLSDGAQTSVTMDTPASANQLVDLVARLGGDAALDLARARRGNIVGAVPLLRDWLEHHLAHAAGVTDGTVAEYRRLAARTWLPTLGEYPLDTLTRDHVARWVAQQTRTLTRRGTPTSAKTIANAHGLLSTVMASAVDAGHRPDNPCRGLRLPSGTREEMTFLTEGEFARVLAAVEPYWQPLVALLAGTGLRWGEATALTWGDLDLEAPVPTLRVSRAWKRGAGVNQGGKVREIGAPKTRRGVRTVSLPPQIADLLRQLRGPATARRGGGYVFTGPQGGTVHHQNFHPRVWRPAVERAGIGKTPRIHDLRHSHASWLIAAGVPLPIIQRRLGHESIQTTVDVYGHLAADTQGLAAQAAAAALSTALPEALPDTLVGELVEEVSVVSPLLELPDVAQLPGTGPAA
ncbi:tyrosine-type recombinase/integrase [Kineococcus terrestris]|uniref:tyrosine-type recombinase/integrase n=1 Tax=Kineococcus terrestris TaxID=2044856 RepID=UPI0034DAD264